MKLFIWLNILFLTIAAYGTAKTEDTVSGSQAVDKLLPISPNELPVKPYRELAYSADDIKKVRCLAKEGVNSKLVKEIFAETSKWMAYSDKELLDLIPGPNALYAWGSAGDPKTNKAWPRYGRSDDVCRVDKPGQVKSPFTGDIYGIQKPGEEYYDAGDGWVRPSDGKRFYFKGVWNSYISYRLHEAVDNLSIAYMLTGNPAMARRALMILDRMSTNRTKRPEADGVCDWPYEMTPDKAYFNYVGNQANGRTVYIGLDFDLLGNAPYAAEPSSFDPNMTVFNNIKQHYFDVYEMWYLETKQCLSNHALILLSNMTIQGVLFGREDYLRAAIEGTYAFLDGTINRDGDYYELAGGYGQLGRDYGGMMISLLHRYNPKRYENAVKLPQPSDYPSELNLGNDPRWYTYCTDMLFRLSALGRYLQYGDWNCDRTVLLNQTYEWLAKRQSNSLLMIHGMVDSPEKRQHIAELYWSMRSEDHAEPLVNDILLYGLSMWQKPEVSKSGVSGKGVQLGSDLMPTKRIAILRGGESVNKRALFIRGGGNSAHSHDDQMALVPYGNGMVLAGEYGYNWSGTPDNMGWGSRAIAHQMATVNKDMPASYIYKGSTEKVTSPSSDITGYLSVGPAQFIEMHNPDMWKAAAKNCKDYRRLAWLVDIDAEHYYFVDMFQIIGGYVHDYAWSAPYDANENKDTFNVSGIKPQVQPGVWTFAALDGQYRDVTWNKPGQSWGERLNGLADGKVREMGLNDTPKNQNNKWNPPPGNGYGMIWDVKTDKPERDWSAVWKLQDGKRYLRTDVFNFDGMTAVIGRSPSLLIDKHHHVIIARREQDKNLSSPLHSRFANITQVGTPGNWSLERVEKLAVKTSGDKRDAIVLLAVTADGTMDYLLASRQSQRLENDKVRMEGCRGFARIDAQGQLVHLAMQESTSIEAGGWKLQTNSERLEAKVINVKAGWNENRLTIDKTLPAGQIIEGSMVLIDSPPGAVQPYTHNEYYYIEKVEPADNNGCTLVFEKQSLVATRLHIRSVDLEQSTIYADWSNELAGLLGTFELNGKMVAVQGKPEKSTIIRSYVCRDMKVLCAADFDKDDYLDVYVAKPKDILTMPATVTLTRQGDGRYLLRTNVAVTLTTTAVPDTQLLAQVYDKPPHKLAVTDAEGKLQVTIDPAKLMIGKIWLWLQEQ